MLRRLSIIVAIMLCISTISCAETPNIYIEDVVKKENEDKVTMNLYLDNVDSNLASLGLNINYDDKKLEYISSKTGKNLKTTVQMAEYEENSKVSIEIMSSDGFKADGVYYQVTFKVLDDTIDEIPVNLEVKDAKDVSGNSIKCSVSNGTIYTNESKIPNDDKLNNEKSDDETTMDPFDKTDVKPSDSLDDIIESNTPPGISNKDDLKYDVEDGNVLEVLPDGTMVAKQDGITEVKVMLNDEEIGKLEVETENGQIKRISSKEEKQSDETNESKQENEFNTTNKVKKTSVTESGKNVSPLLLLFILIVIIIISVIVYKKKYKNTKKEKKNEKVN